MGAVPGGNRYHVGDAGALRVGSEEALVRIEPVSRPREVARQLTVTALILATCAGEPVTRDDSREIVRRHQLPAAHRRDRRAAACRPRRRSPPPAVEFELGGVVYGFDSLLGFLEFCGEDASLRLARERRQAQPVERLGRDDPGGHRRGGRLPGPLPAGQRSRGRRGGHRARSRG